MCNCNAFWWDWWVNFAAAFGTVAAVIVALFGEKIRAKFHAPQIKLSLLSSNGEKITVNKANTINGKTINVEARYFHIHVTNKKKWPALATEAQIYLVMLEELELITNTIKAQWQGDVPLLWKNQNMYPTLRTIGSPIDCDFCSITEEKMVNIHTLFVPNNLVAVWQTAFKANFYIELRYREGVSNRIQLQVEWDGQWYDDDTEFNRHFKIVSEEISKMPRQFNSR